jgi:hypothetical protein
VAAQSASPAAPSAYKTALSALPSIEKVDVLIQPSRDNLTMFTVAVTFRPETIQPMVVTP